MINPEECCYNPLSISVIVIFWGGGGCVWNRQSRAPACGSKNYHNYFYNGLYLEEIQILVCYWI